MQGSVGGAISSYAEVQRHVVRRAGACIMIGFVVMQVSGVSEPHLFRSVPRFSLHVIECSIVFPSFLLSLSPSL